MRMNKSAAFCLALLVAGMGAVFAIEIKGTAPTFDGIGVYDLIEERFNQEIATAFNEIVDSINDEVKNIDDKPEKLLQSMGNSGVFASHGATQRAFGGYKFLAITAGSMIGLQLPTSPFSIMDEMGNLQDKIMEEGDVQLGLNAQMFNAQVSMNMSKLLLKDLYLGLRIGFINLDGMMGMVDGLTFNNFMIGATANYQLLKPINLAGVILWRGVNVGSGIIYQGTNLGIVMNNLPSYNQEIPLITIPSVPGTPIDIPSELKDVKLSVVPRITLDMKINTVTIPLEATTAVRLLYFLNIPFGIGADLGFGKSDLKIGANADINVDEDDLGAYTRDLPYFGESRIEQTAPGSLSATAGGSRAPSFFNFKLMTGLGFNMGPVVLDIPVTIYLGNNGYNVGITLGVVL